MGEDAHAIDGDDEVVANPAALAGTDVLDHALMAQEVNLQADDFALLDDASAGDVADVEGLLLLLAGILRGVEACDLHAGARVAPRPLLADVAEGLETDGGLFVGHSSLSFSNTNYH